MAGMYMVAHNPTLLQHPLLLWCKPLASIITKDLTTSLVYNDIQKSTSILQ